MITHLKIQSKLIMKVGTVLAMQAKSKKGKQIIKTSGKFFLVESLNESIGRYKIRAINGTYFRWVDMKYDEHLKIEYYAGGTI